jgi:three-Cys-motif partner protein
VEIGEKDHRFGGDWTSQKLRILERYLSAYRKVMQNQPFRVGYIDAFAGTGYRAPKAAERAHAPLLFPDLAEPEPQALLDGSARLALQVQPPFERYIFIEKSKARCEALETLKSDFSELSSAIEVRRGEANSVIQELCNLNWDAHRAVLFLDPYGMQVEWKTIECIAGTKAIDMWLLFPLGIGVNRLLCSKPEEIPPSWRNRLTTLLGTDAWENELFVETGEKHLFGNEERVVKASMERIGRYFVDRLKTVFPGVAERPAVLQNSTGSPLYLFCFAAANEKGAKIALNIAEHLLSENR